MSEFTVQSIGHDKAVQLGESRWWEDVSPECLVRFQLFTEEICCEFQVFHRALETCLGRGVSVHELGSEGMDNIRREFLGEKTMPSLGDIIKIIPEEKRLLIFK